MCKSCTYGGKFGKLTSTGRCWIGKVKSCTVENVETPMKGGVCRRIGDAEKMFEFETHMQRDSTR